MLIEKKKKLRQKRIWRIRKKVRGTASRPRLCVHFSNKHIYAQAIDDDSGKTLVCLTSLDKDLKKEGLKANREYGDYHGGRQIVTEETREAMRKILEDVRSGAYAKVWIDEDREGRPNFMARRREEQEHQIETVGAELRRMMPFLDAVTLKESV